MISECLKTSNSAEWATPQKFFDDLNEEFHFTLDPCSTHENAKCEKHYTKEEDGLRQSWFGETVYLNPPYGREIRVWLEKAKNEYLNDENMTIVMLLPSRTDTNWFHDYIYHKADEIRFIKRRLRFNGADADSPFPSIVVIFRARAQKEKANND